MTAVELPAHMGDDHHPPHKPVRCYTVTDVRGRITCLHSDHIFFFGAGKDSLGFEGFQIVDEMPRILNSYRLENGQVIPFADKLFACVLVMTYSLRKHPSCKLNEIVLFTGSELAAKILNGRE